MTPLVVRFEKFEKALVMQVLEQDESTRGKGKLFEHGGMNLWSGYTPELYRVDVYVWGSEPTYDMSPVSQRFPSNEERDSYLAKCQALIAAYNASLVESVTEWEGVINAISTSGDFPERLMRKPVRVTLLGEEPEWKRYLGQECEGVAISGGNQCGILECCPYSSCDRQGLPIIRDVHVDPSTVKPLSKMFELSSLEKGDVVGPFVFSVFWTSPDTNYPWEFTDERDCPHNFTTATVLALVNAFGVERDGVLVWPKGGRS